MNIVAIDTATEAFSVALKCHSEQSGSNTLHRYSIEPRMHAKLLLPALDDLFAEAELSRSMLNAVAFGRGPGAFTGVRIATAASQAIAMAFNIPVAPVSTLAAIALRAHREKGAEKIAVAIDARMGEVYWGAYRINNGLPELHGEEKVCAPDQVPKVGTEWTAAGTGWDVWAEQLQRASGAEIINELPALPHALDILQIGENIIKQGKGVDAAKALPVYLRDNVAKTEAERAATK